MIFLVALFCNSTFRAEVTGSEDEPYHVEKDEAVEVSCWGVVWLKEVQVAGCVAERSCRMECY